MQRIYEDHGVATPAAGTALIVDLRNFTHQLDAAATGEALQRFCARLADFYTLCREMAEIAAPERRFHLASTGDGMLAVFYGERHAREAFLCLLMLRLTITRVLPPQTDAAGVAVSGFGIGAESGDVCRVMANGRATYIGQCINMASRLETITKSFDSADCIVGERLVAQLYADVSGEDFASMSAQAIDADLSDAGHLALLSRFAQANQALCLNFLHYHRLKGVDRPMALHGISKRAGLPGNPRFEALLRTLSAGEAQATQVRNALRAASAA